MRKARKYGARGALMGLVGLAAVLVPTVAQASDLLDQSQLNANSEFEVSGPQSGGMLDEPATVYAQTITAGVSGVLDRVDLYGRGGYSSTSPLVVSIYATAGGVPTGTALSTADVPAGTLTEDSHWFDVPIGPAVPVTKGQQFAVVLSTVDNVYGLETDYCDTYAGGSEYRYDEASSAWTDQRCDLTFQTYVDAGPSYSFGGFQAPIDASTLNVLKAGQGVPVKFNLGGDQGLDIFSTAPTSQPVACDGSMPSDPVEDTTTAGASGLSYDATTDTYTYLWKTDRAWAGTCRQLTLSLKDGSTHTALFQLK